MKKTIIILSLIITHLGFSQVTDTGDKVGIGTTTPEAKLEVTENSSTDAVALRLTNSGWTSLMSTSLEFKTGYAKSVPTSKISSIMNGSGNAGDRLGFFVQENGTNPNNNPLVEKLSLLPNGNVGIGTKNPSEKLDVNGLIRIPQANNQDNNSPGIIAQINDDFLYDNQYINNYAFGFHGFQDGSTTFTEPMNAYMSGYFGVDFFTSGLNRMRISRDGIVSIGTINRQTGYKLAVNGKIKAKEIKVETGWADFVFNKDYNLPTLKDVEQHIKDKGHLKDIPSAEAVKKNGIFLGEMDAKLLQKIEELTLYTIAQQKQIEALEKTNKKLEKEKSVLKSLLERVKKLEEKIKS